MPPSLFPLLRSLSNSTTPVFFTRPLATHWTLTHTRVTATPFKSLRTLSHHRAALRIHSQTHPRFLPDLDRNAFSNTSVARMEELTGTLQKLGLDKIPSEPNTYPAHNPFDLFRSHVTELLSQASGIEHKIIYPTLQKTVKSDHGDLQLAVQALRQKRKDMAEFAKELGDKFPESPLVEKPTVTGTFLNFFYKPEPLAKLVLPQILKAGPSYGFAAAQHLGLKDPADPSKGRKKIIVEFSSPNIAKPFHAGHLRSTIIGGFLANLYDGAGWDVIRMNYLGDWGKQYGVLAVGFDLYGSEEKLVENPIGHLYDVYVKISKKAAEEGDVVKAAKEEIAKAEGGNTSELEAKIKDIEENGVDQQARQYFVKMCNGDEVGTCPHTCPFLAANYHDRKQSESGSVSAISALKSTRKRMRASTSIMMITLASPRSKKRAWTKPHGS